MSDNCTQEQILNEIQQATTDFADQQTVAHRMMQIILATPNHEDQAAVTQKIGPMKPYLDLLGEANTPSVVSIIWWHSSRPDGVSEIDMSLFWTLFKQTFANQWVSHMAESGVDYDTTSNENGINSVRPIEPTRPTPERPLIHFYRMPRGIRKAAVQRCGPFTIGFGLRGGTTQAQEEVRRLLLEFCETYSSMGTNAPGNVQLDTVYTDYTTMGPPENERRAQVMQPYRIGREQIERQVTVFLESTDARSDSSE